ncbi:MAG TPA: hypothetical protein VHX63_01595 [Acidobacteriaceae bacterium]|jgi:hypothetical protein|nr:hypothetical protein [Acidobacteriaceae bacterium]
MNDSALRAQLAVFHVHRSSLEDWLLFWTWLVIIGVACECVFIILDHRKDWREWFEGQTAGVVSLPSKPSLFKLTLEILSVVFVVAGVSGELVIDSRLGTLETNVQDNNDQRVSGATDRATVADTKRVQLENRMLDIFGPRYFTSVQSAYVVKHLAGLKGVKIDVFVLALGNSSASGGDSDDPADFARTVVQLLRAAHMDAEGWVVSSCFGGSASGFNVSLHLPGSVGDRKIASEVLNAFRPNVATYREVLPTSSGDFCQAFSPLAPSRPNTRKHDAAVSITIGTKVQPILTREMLEPEP